MSDDRWRRVRLAVAIALAVHLALGLAVAKAPEPDALPLTPQRDEVDTFSQKVELPRPRPAPKKEEPPPPPPPKPPPPPPKAPQPAEPTAVASTSPAPKPAARAPSPKPRKAPRRGKPTPKTVSLGNVGLGGDVVVHHGAVDVLGDPGVAPTEETTRPDEPQEAAPRDTPGTGAGAPAASTVKPDAPMVVVAPKVKSAKRGVYPADAPRLGRRVPVTMSLKIGPDGRVKSARIITKPHDAGTAFDAEARRLAMALQFEPATRDGVPIPFTIRYIVEFEP